MVVDAMNSFTLDRSVNMFVTNSMDEEEVCAPETRTRSSVEKEGVVRVPVCVCACGRSVGYAEPCVSRTAAWGRVDLDKVM